MSTPILSPILSAGELHKVLLQAFQLGNCALHVFLVAYRTLYESGGVGELGCSNILHYGRKHFRLEETQTREYLRVAKALEDLPRCRERFVEGGICFSALQEISRVATTETEAEWLEFEKKRSYAQLKAEVQDARKKGRDRPRSDGGGMPRMRAKVCVEMEQEEHELFLKGMKKVAAELSRSLGGESVSLKSVLLFLSERALETDPADTPPGHVEREESPFAVIYQRCPCCRKGHTLTQEGAVETPDEVIDRIEAEAHKEVVKPEQEVRPPAKAGPAETLPPADTPAGSDPEREIDPPRPPRLRRKALLRDGCVCANPHCQGRRGLHEHHMDYRSNGGPTALHNLITLCAYCHSLIHQGRLSLRWNPATGEIEFLSRSDAIRTEFEKEAKRLAELAQVFSGKGPAPSAPPC